MTHAYTHWEGKPYKTGAETPGCPVNVVAVLAACEIVFPERLCVEPKSLPATVWDDSLLVLSQSANIIPMVCVKKSEIYPLSRHVNYPSHFAAKYRIALLLVYDSHPIFTYRSRPFLKSDFICRFLSVG